MKPIYYTLYSGDACDTFTWLRYNSDIGYQYYSNMHKLWFNVVYPKNLRYVDYELVGKRVRFK